jgi:hypothetical protein
MNLRRILQCKLQKEESSWLQKLIGNLENVIHEVQMYKYSTHIWMGTTKGPSISNLKEVLIRTSTANENFDSYIDSD